jgi:hypothetical protein
MPVTTGQEAALKGLRAYRKELADSIKAVEDRIDGIDQEIERIQRDASLPGFQSLANSSPSQGGEQVAGPQETVCEFLRQHPGEFFKPAVAARMIRESGYIPRHPKVWATQVATALKRAVDKEVADMKEIDGKRAYGLRVSNALR